MGAWVKRSRRANTYGDKGNLRALLSAFRSWFARAVLVRLMLSELLESYMPLAQAAGRRICAHYEHESS